MHISDYQTVELHKRNDAMIFSSCNKTQHVAAFTLVTYVSLKNFSHSLRNTLYISIISLNVSSARILENISQAFLSLSNYLKWVVTTT